MAQVEERQDVQKEILLTSEDLAKVFNVDVSTVEGWVNSKLLSAIFVTSRNDIRFGLDAICKFINEQEQIWLPNFKLENEVYKDGIVKNGRCND
jgi:hypothetical protein